jgi:hypothetical protein
MKAINEKAKSLLQQKYELLRKGNIGSKMTTADRNTLYKDVLFMYAQDLNLDVDSNEIALLI